MLKPRIILVYLRKYSWKWLTIILFGIRIITKSISEYLGPDSGVWLQIALYTRDVKCVENMSNKAIIRILALVLAMVVLSSSLACAPKSQPEPLAFISVPTNNISVNAAVFSPADVIMATGTSITWTNLDAVSYFIEDNSQQFAFTLPAEGTFSLSFPETGTFYYHCGNNPKMQGSIIVVNGTGA